MKAISLWQPWASALFAPAPGFKLGGRAIKQNETRSWRLPDWAVGVPIALHAAKRDTRDEKEFWVEEILRSPHRQIFGEAFAAIGIRNYTDLPRGCIIGTVVFGCPIDVDFMIPEELESKWGNFSSDRWAWPTIGRNHFKEPIPCVGRQGFFDWDMQCEVPA